MLHRNHNQESYKHHEDVLLWGTITIKNMPNSKIKTTVLNSYHDFKIEREKRWVTDLEREMNVDKDEEYKTKDQS